MLLFSYSEFVFQEFRNPTASIIVYCLDFEWLYTGFGLETGLIDHFNTQLLTTLNYSAIADLHTLQITTEHTKYFQPAVTSRFTATDLNNGDYSAAVLKRTDWVFSSHTPLQLWRTPFESESESVLLYDWRFTANQFVLATSPLSLTVSIFSN
jgi:hypothetical protein